MSCIMDSEIGNIDCAYFNNKTINFGHWESCSNDCDFKKT